MNDANAMNNGPRVLDGPPSKDVTTANGCMVEVEREDGLFHLTVCSPEGDRQSVMLDGIEVEDIAMALAPIAYYEVRSDEACRARDRAINAFLYLIREAGAEKDELLKIVDEAWEWDK